MLRPGRVGVLRDERRLLRRRLLPGQHDAGSTGHGDVFSDVHLDGHDEWQWQRNQHGQVHQLSRSLQPQLPGQHASAAQRESRARLGIFGLERCRLQGSNPTCFVTMTGNQNVSATFTQSSYTLTVSPSGQGSIFSSDGFINCPGSCSHTYLSFTQVTLNAAPAHGWNFAGWAALSAASARANSPCWATMV